MQNELTSMRSADFERSAKFLRAHARPLEVARFEHVFYGSAPSHVLVELGKFQNVDGGFGHALEADLRVSDSSCLCTSIAFQIMRCHQVPENETMVRQGISYLIDTLDRGELHWRIIPEAAETSPRAPWWNQKGREEEFRVFSLNPTAEILGYLLDYGASVVDERTISQVADRVIESLRVMKKIEMHDLLCCLRLLETKNLPSLVRDSVQSELQRLVADTVAVDPEQWKDYSLRPLQVVHHPNSPFMDGLKAAVSINLDYEIAEQGDDGSWLPTWTWGDAYPDVWEEVKREWSGVLTLDKLLCFKRFGRLEPHS